SVTGMRIEPGYCNLRVVISRLFQAGPSQFELSQNSFDSQGRGYVLERNMRRYARIPNLLQNVEFTDLAREVQHIGNKADFVVVAWICKPHGLLVERREANGLRVTCLGKLQCGAKVVGRESSSDQCGLATHDILRIEILQVDEHMP